MILVLRELNTFDYFLSWVEDFITNQSHWDSVEHVTLWVYFLMLALLVSDVKNIVRVNLLLK
jgi:hypothetical protein